MEERRQESNGDGRREGDSWLPRGKEIWGAIALVLILVGWAFNLYASALTYPQTRRDVDDLKLAVPVILYLVCRDHANANPNERLPALCNQAIGGGPK